MPPSRRTSEVRQVELIDAALRVIATRGVAALTTRTLAEQVGLSSGAIFRHFASLDALLDAVVTRVENVLEATYPPADLPALERLDRFVEARSAAVGGRVGILQLVQSEQFHLALPAPAAARLAACVQRSRRFVVECVRDGQRTGEIRADLDAAALAAVIMGTTALVARATANPRRGAVDSRAVRDTLFALLRPAAGARRRRRRTS